MKIAGGCFCGAVSYEAEGLPNRVTNCHCKHCRRLSGAPFVTWAEFDDGKFDIIKGEPGQIASRPEVTRQYCQACGTPLTFAMTEPDGFIYVTVCSMDESESITPQDNTWASRALPWVKLDDDLPRYEESGFPASDS